jgi:hypothetical protein
MLALAARHSASKTRVNALMARQRERGRTVDGFASLSPFGPAKSGSPALRFNAGRTALLLALHAENLRDIGERLACCFSVAVSSAGPPVFMS